MSDASVRSMEWTAWWKSEGGHIDEFQAGAAGSSSFKKKLRRVINIMDPK